MTSDDYARAIIGEGQRKTITERGIVAALSTALVESNLVMYANYGDPESLNYPHDAIGSDENSVGLFQQRAPWWGTCADRMDAARSAGMFYDDLSRLDYNNPGQTAGWYCYQVQQCAAEYAYRYDERMPEAQELYNRLVGTAPATPATPSGAGEVLLDYDHGVTPQETGYWCGPAAAQVVLNSAGIIVSEQELANAMGTDMDGTDDIGLIQAVLSGYMPDAGYRATYIHTDPPTPAERDTLWLELVNSINTGCGVVMNWVSPPGNHPVGVKGSQSPNYGGGTIWHYVAAMGYDDTEPRAVWIADSGFNPFGYWCAFDQVATLIPPKGYTYAARYAEAPTPPGRPTPGPLLPAELTDREIAEQVWTQLFGPGGHGWPQLGQNANGQYLTLVDAVAVLVNRVPWQ